MRGAADQISEEKVLLAVVSASSSVWTLSSASLSHSRQRSALRRARCGVGECDGTGMSTHRPATDEPDLDGACCAGRQVSARTGVSAGHGTEGPDDARAGDRYSGDCSI